MAEPLATEPLADSSGPDIRIRLFVLTSMSTPSESRHAPFHRLNPAAQLVMRAAQEEAESRGATYVVSGLLLLAAAKSSHNIAARLLQVLRTDSAKLTASVDDEWQSRPMALQDQPFTVISEAVGQAMAAEPDEPVTINRLIAATLRFEDSMASRIAARLGLRPEDVARQLLEQQGG